MAATEQTLVGPAATATASDMDRICAAYRKYGQAGAAAAANQAYANREFRYWYDDDGSLCFSGRVPADSAPLILDMLAAGRAALTTPILDDIEDAENVPAGASGAGERPGENVPAGASGAGERPDQDVPAGTSGAGEPLDVGVPAGTSRVDAAGSLGARTADALLLIAETFLATTPRQRPANAPAASGPRST